MPVFRLYCNETPDCRVILTERYVKGYINTVKVLLFVIAFTLTLSEAYAQLHQPTWFLMDDRAMSSFDMLTTRTGLIAVDDNGVRLLCKYDSGAINGIFPVRGSVTSIIIRDQDLAYFTVKGDGIYQAINGWQGFTQILSEANPFLLAVHGSNILANLSGILYYSDDGVTFHQAGKISPADTISAAEILSSQIALAVTGKKVYRSVDGGKNWSVIIDTLDRTNSVYFDRTHNALYIGGSQLMKSLDSGITWQVLSSIFFTLAGPVVGARDCSGNFYLAPDATTHGAMYRSVDQGRFFQEAGPAIFSSVALKKPVVLDRGSTFFWLDQSGLLGVVRDGIDSAITDSVRDHMAVQVDSVIRNPLCNTTPTNFIVTVSYDQCTGIILDSLKQIAPRSSFSDVFNPGFLGDSGVKDISFTFLATHAGFDTAHYRLRFHSAITENVEEKFFDVIGFGIAGSPDLSLSLSELDFPETGLDSIHKLSVQIINSGCDTLVIDTMFSTNPAIFILDTRKYPVKLPPAKSFLQTISFNPHLVGDYLESMEIISNIGNRFVTLRGTGKTSPTASVEVSPNGNGILFFPNPADNVFSISSKDPLPEKIFLRDQLGKEVLEFNTNRERNFTCDLHSLASSTYFLDFGGGKFESIIIRH